MELLFIFLIAIRIAVSLGFFPIFVEILIIAFVSIIFSLISNAGNVGKGKNIESSLLNNASIITPSNTFYTKVVGVTYTNAQIILPKINRGEQLNAVREKNNKYDDNAIAIYYKIYKLGHLSKDVAADLAPLLDSGTEVKVYVENITGGNGQTYGCNVQIEVF